MKLVIVSILVLVCCCWSLGEGCLTSAECHHDECCVSNNRPIGKRQLSSFLSGGSCRPRGHLNGGCLKRDEEYNATRIYFQCPCVDGLICKGNGMMDIPLGEMGTCVHH